MGGIRITSKHTFSGRVGRALGTASVGLAMFAVAPTSVFADDPPVIDINLPVVVCGAQVMAAGAGAGDCPTTPAPTGLPVTVDPTGLSGDAPTLLNANLPVVVCGNALPLVGVAAAQCPNTLAPAPASTGAINAAVPVTVCGNSVAVGTLASGGCPATSTAAAAGSSPINPSLALGVCGNGVAVLDPGLAGCTTNGSGNAVGLPGGLGTTLPVEAVINGVSDAIGDGDAIDLGQVAADTGLDAIVDPSVNVDLCGNAAAVASSASAGCEVSDVSGDPGSPRSGSGGGSTQSPQSGLSLPLTGASVALVLGLGAAFVLSGAAGRFVSMPRGLLAKRSGR